MIGRRDLLRASALTPLAGLMACAGGSQAVPQWMTAIQAVGQEFALVLPQLQQAGMPASDAATAQQVIAQIQQAATAVGTASSATQGQSALIQIEGAINAIAPIALPFVSLIPGGSILGLIIVALPAIETMLNVTVSLLSAPAKQIAATAPAAAPTTPTAAAAPLDPAQALGIILRQTGH